MASARKRLRDTKNDLRRERGREMHLGGKRDIEDEESPESPRETFTPSLLYKRVHVLILFPPKGSSVTHPLNTPRRPLPSFSILILIDFHLVSHSLFLSSFSSTVSSEPRMSLSFILNVIGKLVNQSNHILCLCHTASSLTYFTTS